MSIFMKKQKSHKTAAAAILGLLTLLATLVTCNSPMGMGPPIDTTPPTIYINNPSDNKFIRGLLQGKPVIMDGNCFDDIGVTSLRFELYNRTAGKSVQPGSVSYGIEPDKKEKGKFNWHAEVIIPEPGTADYNIKVVAQDKFFNEGANDVNIRVDIVPPWIKDAKIARHPESGFNFTAPLYEKDHYVEAGFQLPEAHRFIQSNKLDEYQNEAFTLRVEIEPTFSEVAASRLFVKDDLDTYLHGGTLDLSGLPAFGKGLVPTGYSQTGSAEQRYPEWEITSEQLTEWRSSFSAGARYIFFEVWAWGESAWAGDPATGAPVEGEPGRVQKIDGTVWYPESDNPHVYINPENIISEIITMEPDLEKALAVEFYDDDRLGAIYTKLLTRKDFDDQRGTLSEEDYFAALADPADASGKRAALGMQNGFVSQPGGNNRYQSVYISTEGLAQGEYRLIALAKDDKSQSGYSFEQPITEKWGIYPPMKVQIQSAQAPLVIMENPERENIFPNLTSGGGNSFSMSGYTLGKSATHTVEIAWVPKSLQNDGINLAMTVLNSTEVEGLSVNQSLTAANGIKVWKLSPQEPEPTVINGTDYFKTDFSQWFHILNDFQFGGVPENDDKLFVIRAIAGAETFKTFNLLGLKTGPTVEVTSHGRGAGHDPGEDLVLSMRASPGNYGVAVAANSQIITDITDNPVTGSDISFNGITSLVAGEWQRTVTSLYIKGDENTPGHYPEGMIRYYAFRATDILGNTTQLERDITLSTKPLLESITCANGEGTYGIGEELRFEALFSMPVRATPNNGNYPRLKLYVANPGNSTNVATTRYANYNINTPSGNTLIFTYTVQEGDTTTLLHTSLDPIDLNSAAVISYKGDDARIELFTHVNSLQNTTPITLDATRPKIDRASFERFAGYDNNNSGISYFNNGRTITLKLITSEPVIISGNPMAVIRYGTTQLNAQFTSKTAGGSGETLTFTHTVNDTVNGNKIPIPLTRLEWGAPWFDFSNGSAITDMVGNDIVSTGYNTSLTDANRWGQASGAYQSEQGYVKTTTPPTPTYTLNGGTDPVSTNTSVNLVVSGREQNGTGWAKLYYSLQGGNASTEITGTGNGTATITDQNVGNRYLTSYERSQYAVTAWQEDLAGNRSAQAATRQVIINSRWPDLTGIDFDLPDGSYGAGTEITFRMNFSGRVQPQTNASVNLNIAGIATGATGTAAITNATATTEGNGLSTLLSVKWTVPNNLGNTMKDIKARSITFTNIQDEYGNVLRGYSGTTAESASNPNRPIGDTNPPYTFQLNRQNVEIRSIRPQVTSAIPTLPTASGVDYNGGIITNGSGKTFRLTFDVSVSKVSGKYITVRPYGQWAIPPVLSPADFSALKNAAVSEEHKKRLTNIDTYGVPFADSIRGNANAYNSYIETTHGVTSINSNIRPDTSAKWVLAFDIDPYTTTGTPDRTALLREVFNAVGWKQQRIPISSGQVVVSGANVDVTLNEALLPGRIWEVVLDDGAFQDAAGNPSLPITEASAADNNKKYRFWSAGTETPVIRVDKITYDGRLSYTSPATNARRQANINLGFINADASLQLIPPIDTKVRIDCETPGASIRYNVIRTAYNFAVVGGAVVNGLNPVLGGTTGTDNGFFGTVPHITGYTEDGGQGYARNTIGNEDRTDANNLTNGFFNKLLVPNAVQTGTAALANGTFAIGGMTTLQDGLRNSPTTPTNLSNAGNQYRTVAATGAVTQNTPGSLTYLFIGDAYGGTSNTVNAHTSPFLYSGRRDYIVAAAQKVLVDNTASDAGKRFAGPLLNVSTTDLAKPYAGMEGVYKTTMIYRNPNNNAYRLLLDGRTELIYDGNPIPGFGMDDLNPSATDRYESIAYKTFYRVGGNLGDAPNATNRNHILVSWEFVADIKRSRPAFYTSTANNSNQWGEATTGAAPLNRNSGFISAPYGGVSYRSGGF